MAYKKDNSMPSKKRKSSGKKGNSIDESIHKNVKKQVKKIKKAHPLIALFLAVIFIIICVGAFFVYKKINENNFNAVEGELSIHVLELGNNYAGDCIYIKAGETDILVDSGSRESSLNTVKNYLGNYLTDNKFEYIIATHADQDHIVNFAADNGLFESYECDTIIDFPKTNKTTSVYNSYIAKRDAKVSSGSVHYNALQCYNNEDGAKREYEISDGIKLKILYNYYYENYSTDENNYSVCFLITQGSRNFLFTGDLEKEGEAKLITNNNLPECDFYKAGHHGSKTSSTLDFLNIIKPKIVAVSCCAGSVEYTQEKANTFPTQDFIDRISSFTDKVFVTTYTDTKINETNGRTVNDGTYKLLNGNIVIKSSADKEIEINCSNNNVTLKNTDWLLENRTIPTSWNKAA